MIKTDRSKHKISIASIKRSTFKPYDYKLTKFYESNLDFPYSELRLDLEENELIISSTFIDSKNYSILTTQKLITKENGIESVGNIIGATDKGYGDFKGHKDDALTVLPPIKLKIVNKCNISRIKPPYLLKDDLILKINNHLNFYLLLFNLKSNRRRCPNYSRISAWIVR